MTFLDTSLFNVDIATQCFGLEARFAWTSQKRINISQKVVCCLLRKLGIEIFKRRRSCLYFLCSSIIIE